MKRLFRFVADPTASVLAVLFALVISPMVLAADVRNIVVGISNGYNGYLPTPEHHKLGGCETWLGTNKVPEDTSVILTDQLLEMLAELAKRSIG